MIALRTCAGGSRYLISSRYNADKCMSNATRKPMTQLIVERAQAQKLSLDPFTVYELRRIEF